MRYCQIRSMDISNGRYIGCSIFLQGCSIHCKNCFQPETWDFNGGKEWTSKEGNELKNIIIKPYIKRLSILGGEPLDQAEDLEDILFFAKNIRPDIEIWLYSGRTFEENWEDPIKQRCIRLCDVMVDGQYRDDLKDMNLLYRGSSNQRIIDIQNTIKKHQIVLFDLLT